MAIDAVLIDGPADRRRMVVEEEQDIIRVAEMGDIQVNWAHKDNKVRSTVKQHEYLRMGTTPEGTRVYAWNGPKTKLFEATALRY